MRDILAVLTAADLPATSSTVPAITAAVLIVASILVLVPAIMICGFCEESKPVPGPVTEPVADPAVSGKQSTASSSIPIPVAAPAVDPTIHPPEPSVFDENPRSTGVILCDVHEMPSPELASCVLLQFPCGRCQTRSGFQPMPHKFTAVTMILQQFYSQLTIL